MSCNVVLQFDIKTNSIPGKVPEINQDPPHYSMLQHIGREATPKLLSGNCHRYLQTTLMIGGGGLASEFI